MKIHELIKSDTKKNISKAIKLVKAEGTKDYDELLFDVLQTTLSNKQRWDISSELIQLLGEHRYSPLEPIVEQICSENLMHDLITSKAAIALCQLRAVDGSDVTEVKRLLTFGNFSVISGALDFLGIEKIIPTESEQDFLIDSVAQLSFEEVPGRSDIRLGLALACAGWDKRPNVVDFLLTCVESKSSYLRDIATKSLNNKYRAYS